MKVLLCGKDLKEITKLVKTFNIELTTKKAELIIAYGGDGTLIHAERLYPEVPKLPMRNSKVCKKCSRHENQKVIQDFLHGKLELKKYRKLHTNIYGKDLFALNEFVIRNKLPIQAIRFRINEKFFIGDGIVTSTPFGSTGYFKSITGKSFTNGFALALNNTTEKAKPIFFSSNSSVEFELIRGNAVLAYDNCPDMYNLSVGTKLRFKFSSKFANIYNYKAMRCSDCKINRGQTTADSKNSNLLLSV
jgi:NAD+ kinase